MAIPNIQLGRIESDPLAIPMAASMRTGEESPFDRMLRESVANESNDNGAPPQERAEETPVDSGLENASDDVPDAREVADGDTEPPADVHDEGADPEAVDLGDDVTESVERGDSEQPTKSPTKTQDANRSTPVTSEPLIAATIQGQNTGQQQLNAAGQNATQQAPTAKTVEPTIRGTGNAAIANNTKSNAPSVQGAYSAKSAAQAQLLEQARDSVFKQILMKLNSEGGEVRMRLEPPDLGQLDLRMTVERGNKLSLTISADRQDINSLLQRHLDELKQTLQESGLEITGAEVQTRSEFEHQQAQRDAADGGFASNDTTSNDAETTPQPLGFTAGGGLDFLA